MNKKDELGDRERLSLKFLFQQSKTLKAFRRRGDFCDVKICFGNGSSFLAHKCVLASASPMLQMHMYTHCDNEQMSPNISLPENLLPSFEVILDFIYTGYLSVTMSNVSSLIRTGQALELLDIRNVCVRFLDSEISLQSWLLVYKVASEFKLNDVLENLLEFLVEKYWDFSLLKGDLIQLDHSTFSRLLAMFRLSNDSKYELRIVKDIIQWLNYDVCRAVYISDLLNDVNMDNIDSCSELICFFKVMHLQDYLLKDHAFQQFSSRLNDTQRAEKVATTIEPKYDPFKDTKSHYDDTETDTASEGCNTEISMSSHTGIDKISENHDGAADKVRSQRKSTRVAKRKQLSVLTKARKTVRAGAAAKKTKQKVIDNFLYIVTLFCPYYADLLFFDATSQCYTYF